MIHPCVQQLETIARMRDLGWIHGYAVKAAILARYPDWPQSLDRYACDLEREKSANVE